MMKPVMDEAERPSMVTLADEATYQSYDLAIRRMPLLIAEMESAGMDTPTAKAEYLREELERRSSWVCDLILAQPPKQLLGYVWSTHFIKLLNEKSEQGHDFRPNKAMLDMLQFILEYMHAVWSCNSKLTDEGAKLDEEKVAELFTALEKLRNTTMFYCMMKSKALEETTGQTHMGEISIRAMSAWVNLRGRRYQVLEEEFLLFVLTPHDEALRKTYGMGANAIASGVQAIANSMRTGLFDAMEQLAKSMEAVSKREAAEVSILAAIALEGRTAVDDLVNGGICNLSRHTDLTLPLLQDLSFLPGENKEFLAEGELNGTPLRTLPALVKPCIRLGDEYYTTDGQFVRDVAYRTIQRGLLQRNPEYQQEWTRKQQNLIEKAFQTIFARQFKDAVVFHSVFFRDSTTGQWVETDLAVVVEDVLLIVEAKAGVMAMHSPASDFDRHMRSVDRLISGAYRQCKRFLEYMGSSSTVPIYDLCDGEYVEIGDLCIGDFRRVLPIGLTVESLAPFSSCVHHLEEITPLIGKHAFMSMSVDDLLLLNRFLPTTGELIHYLEVRQEAGAVPNTTLFDEMEYLGAYIVRNRFDTDLKKQQKQAYSVLWNMFSDVVDKYFEGEDVGKKPVPRQKYPAELEAVLRVLDKKRPTAWLEMDSAIRNLNGAVRETLSKSIAALKKTLESHRHRRMLMFNGMPIQVWVCMNGKEPAEQELRHQAELASIIADAATIRVLRLTYNKKRKLRNVVCRSYPHPSRERSDFAVLQHEALAEQSRSTHIE